MAVLKKCVGLHTFENELALPEGSLVQADNVVIDADNTIESRRGFFDFGTSFGNGSDRLKQMFTYKNRLLRHYNDILQFDSDSEGTFLDFDGSYSELDAGLRIKGLEAQSNFFFTTDSGIKKISALTSSDFTTNSGFIEDAGIVKAVDLSAKLLPITGGFLDPQSKCAYRVLWGKKDRNNNLLLGSPSARVILENTNSQITTPEQFTIDFSGGGGASETNVAGKYILFSDTLNDYYLWFKNASFTTPPQTSETISRIALAADVTSLGASTANIVAVAANTIGTLSSFDLEVSGNTIIVTNNENGENTSDASIQTGGITNVTLTINAQGNIVSGTSANATIEITVPQDINSTDFFYQLYRTAPITAITGVELSDLDPGDEMNLVFESNITTAEIAAGIVSFEDITTEDFRISGSFLYTNANTGEGILQANERPPIAKDIESFRNSVFYANTKTVHRLDLNLLSVGGFTSGTSNIIIGNNTVTREYTFIGETEIFDITTDTYANTTADSIILINSAENERKYYVWFDKGGGTDPEVSERIGVRVDISILTTAAQIAIKLAEAINSLDDFDAVDDGIDTVSVVLAKNGSVDDPVFGSPAPGGAWTLLVTTQGQGEDIPSQEILLSSLTSISQAIDETARSLVRVINRDSLSPVNAFYQSGPNDLPGIILFENKSLENVTFFLATSDSAIVTKFNPELPRTETITAISINNPTQITSAGHGLANNSKVYIYNTDSTPTLLGEYTISFIDVNTFSVPVNVTSAGTTGIYFKTIVSSDNEEKGNRVYYSKLDQPEAVPIVNYLDVGAKDKPINRIIALRDNLFVLKEDGVFIITGTSAPDFGARLLDNSVSFPAPDTAVVLNNLIFVLASEGISTISESGVEIISRPIENKILGFTNFKFINYKTVSFGVAYDSDRSYLLWAPSLSTDTVATQCYRYNSFTQTWTRWTKSATCGIVNSDVDKMYLGAGTQNYTEQERKNRDRTDYADSDFALSIATNSINGTSISISSVANIVKGDVLVQTQYVTISHINRLLRKLDADVGLTDNDYYSTLEASQGDSLNLVIDALNTKLVADDSSGSITPIVSSTDLETMQTEYNDMIAELNLGACDTSFKDYNPSSGTVPYEVIILSKQSINNKIVVHTSKPLIVGPIQAYKAIDKTIQWASQDFGQTDLLKQVREGTILFDQNNFYSACVSFASDLSQNFDEIEFTSKGVGYFGEGAWGQFVWGGNGNEVPLRTLIPQQKQRCRFIKVKFEHLNAREIIRIIGISLEPRALSKRAYR